MLRILKKTTSSMARTVGSVPAADGDDLSTWELVNASQSDDEDVFSFDGDDATADEEKTAREAREIVIPDQVISMRSLSVSPPMTVPVEMTTRHHGRGDGGDVDDGDDVDGDSDYDVDDELVPWKLKDRFGKQRIRKMGKRGGPNWNNKSKRLPYYYHNRPG